MSARDSDRLPRPALPVVLDALPDPVVITDADGIVVHANAEARDRLGASKYVGVPLTEQVTRGDVAVADGEPLAVSDHPVARALATQGPVTRRLAIRGQDGDRAVFRVSTVPMWDAGRCVGTVTIFTDLAGGIAFQTELTEHAAGLEAIVDSVSDAVFLVDGEGHLVFVNAVGERLLGLPGDLTAVERAVRMDLRDCEGEPLPAERVPSTRALSGERVSGERMSLTDLSGRRRQVVVTAHALRRRDGTTYGALVMMNDVTDAVRARAELEAAREAAEEASHLKDQFIAALSHELRTPLQPILGWTEVLRRHGELDAVTLQAVEAIRRNIRQQVRLVDDLLDLSRIVHGKLTLRFEVFDLRQQVRSAAEPFEEMAALRRVRLSLMLPEAPVPMWGDGARIQQIAGNLIANAVKFTPPGGHVGVHLVVNETDALLEVEDTGDGIAPEELGIIFEAFRQGTSSGRRGGLGIGLDLVKRLVELHDGTVEASSEGRGYGARFTVRLPRQLAQAPPAPAATREDRRLDQREILLIEDNADTRDVMKFMLEAEGARVQTAESGEEGLALARRTRPQLILCDVGLPDIDGLEVARRMRRNPDLTATRLIALTGYGQPDDVRHALDAGFEAHLTKPINLEQLLTLLRDA